MNKDLYLENREYVNDAFSQQKRLIGFKDKKIIFDVGAHIGEISELYTRLFPKHEIHSFEPYKDSFSKLLEKSEKNINIIPNQIALGSNIGKKFLNNNVASPTNSFLETHEKASYYWSAQWCTTIEKIEVDVTTIDYYCKEKNISKIDVLKLDTQGYEFEILKGAESMLSNNQISLIYSEVILSSTYINQKSLAQITDYLDTFGYRLFNIYNPAISKNKELNQIDVIFILSSEKLKDI
ncbi:FkbM family methyltransferase [Arcobacter sp.]|uniref:FkbM family methyltransferase n=1 Tax=unclassified Arcobacter TaxID=2593671 RepID=UPI003B0051E8